MHLENNFTNSESNNDVVDDVVDKINTNKLPSTEVSISFGVYQKFNELLDLMYPTYEDKMNNRQNAIEQIFLLGINIKLKSIQHQQHPCFFEIDGKIPRHDVLFKFACLAYVLENGQNYPFYGEKFLRKTVQSIHNISDPRTIQKYVERILVYAAKMPHASGYNVSKFCESIPQYLKIQASQTLDDPVTL